MWIQTPDFRKTFATRAVHSMFRASTVCVLALLIPRPLLSALPILIFNSDPFPGQTIALVWGCWVGNEALHECPGRDSGN